MDFFRVRGKRCNRFLRDCQRKNGLLAKEKTVRQFWRIRQYLQKSITK